MASAPAPADLGAQSRPRRRAVARTSRRRRRPWPPRPAPARCWRRGTSASCRPRRDASCGRAVSRCPAATSPTWRGGGRPVGGGESAVAVVDEHEVGGLSAGQTVLDPGDLGRVGVRSAGSRRHGRAARPRASRRTLRRRRERRATARARPRARRVVVGSAAVRAVTARWSVRAPWVLPFVTGVRWSDRITRLPPRRTRYVARQGEMGSTATGGAEGGLLPGSTRSGKPRRRRP